MLAEKGYVVVRRFVDPELARVLYNMLLLRQWRGESRRDDQVPTAFSSWGDSTLDALLVTLLPGVEKAAQCRVLPTYSYARLYVNGDAVPRHVDREACEVAATIHLGGTHRWPFRLAPDVSVEQEPGDAVVYLGDRLAHWREPFGGSSFGQLFLNYVRAEGTRREHLHDGRRDAFPPSLTTAYLE